jgi:hypothetical protein
MELAILVGMGVVIGVLVLRGLQAKASGKKSGDAVAGGPDWDGGHGDGGGGDGGD